ncbi:hypothetical protein OIDMADRAFT_34655 [Oidiodendron maius Zn]|uniref:Uncharacterized protein n=1 Tax=Oidiodendron maius (strain Zn) TaxID=913774 RepID=A0A0C3GWJ4_OIDMZ|nr:hypothetical protein OIDMADRAFT_34655 [Oidiodendron maius Zn]
MHEQGPMWKFPTPTTLDESLSRHDDLRLANDYYTAAEKRLGLALRETSNLSVQCLCLAGRIEHVSYGRHDFADDNLNEFPVGHLILTHLKFSESYPFPPLCTSDGSAKDKWEQVEVKSWYYYLSEIARCRITDRIVNALLKESDLGDFHMLDTPSIN